jgi:hypothetical protein
MMSELSCSVGFHIDNPGEANSKERVMLQLTGDKSVAAHLMSVKAARNLALQLWMMADQVEEDYNE